MPGAVYLCGPTTVPGPRSTECPEALHDWPLPEGFISASEEANWRLRHGWSQGRRCAKCGLYGWRGVGQLREGQTAARPSAAPETEKEPIHG